MTQQPKNLLTLAKWIWRSYRKTAIIPFVLLELVFLGIYFGINGVMKIQLTELVGTAVNNQIRRIVSMETTSIDYQLSSVKYSTEFYAAQMGRALQTPAELRPADAARLVYSPEGPYYTAYDSGGAAVYYSGYMTVGDAERQKAARALTMQDQMKDICMTNPLVSSIYLNTYDSLNIIYPYFDVIRQYTPRMNIPSFNFYYDADAIHNPRRTQRWTDVYLDPAGHGWMTSSIAPVYNGDFLEGVVGLDVTVSNITDQILKFEVPDNGYGLLVGGDGTILAIPNQGEADWGLTELKGHHYDEAIKQDTFKPDGFNLNNMKTMKDFAAELAAHPNGLTVMTIGKSKNIVSWDTISQTGWKLILVIKQSNVNKTVDDIGFRLQMLGIAISAGMILFFAAFFWMLNRRSKRMSESISRPLVELSAMAQRIGAGNYIQDKPEYHVRELQETTDSLVSMGRQLGEINSDLLEVQEELREKESYLQTIIQSFDDAIVELDENGIITSMYLNDSVELLKMKRRFTSIDTAFEPEQAKKVRQMLHEVIDTGKTRTLEAEVDAADGKIWVQARFSIVHRDPIRIVVTVRDMSKRKQMEAAIMKARDDAEAASRSKSQFLSNMSHELRTPLNAVLGFAQVLEMDPATPLTGMQKECIDEIMKAGNHLLELINEVLDLARIEAGKARLSIEPVDIRTVVEETMMLILPIQEKYGITVDTEIADCGGMYIRADKTKLKQIFINLLSNAIKYNKPGGKVRFFCERADETVCFHVVDTGVGIPDWELEAIFMPFHRLGSTRNNVEGTGVGLTVVKQLTEMMGGRISVSSQEGQGSHFTVELPVADEIAFWGDKEDLKEEIWNDSSAAVVVTKILYIEDNQANLKLAARMFKLMPGSVFLSAQTAEQGIEIALKEKPDIILLDINLPGMDGYEAFENLQKHPQTKDIPVIAVSSNAMEREIGRAMRMGFFDYVTKPIKADDFFERIRRVLNREQK